MKAGLKSSLTRFKLINQETHIPMKVVILAGGYGTRLSEETAVRPKPMVEVGEQPILWHIMKIYYAHGIDDFIICCGYKGEVIKQYFSDYLHRQSDITFDFEGDRRIIHNRNCESWKVTLIDTGMDTMTGGRLKRVRSYLDGETFCMTYGDGVSDVDISDLIKFHRSQETLATLTAIQPSGRFGVFKMDKSDTRIDHFREKPQGDGAWINGGFFVLEPNAIDYIEGDQTVWEQEPLVNLANDGELSAYRHPGFWQPMDTLRDKRLLEDLWENGDKPWKVW